MNTIDECSCAYDHRCSDCPLTICTCDCGLYGVSTD